MMTYELQFNSHRSTLEEGFSFIELMVVIVITSIVIGVTAPALSRFYKGVKLDASARQLKTFISYAEEIALSEKKTVRIKFESVRQRLLLMKQKDAKDKAEENVRVEGLPSTYNLMMGISIKNIEVNKKNVQLGNDFFVDIYPLFSQQEVLFLLEDEESNKVSVIIEAGSGRIVIK